MLDHKAFSRCQKTLECFDVRSRLPLERQIWTAEGKLENTISCLLKSDKFTPKMYFKNIEIFMKRGLDHTTNRIILDFFSECKSTCE